MGLKRRGTKRPLTDKDIDMWLHAADHRSNPTSRNEIIAYMKAKNPARWWRINYDYRWLKKQMKKLGLNPDEAKDLLL